MKSFLASLVELLPGYQKSVLALVAKEKTEVLRLHDTIEESDMSRKEKLSSPRWRKVKEHAQKEGELLGLERAYGFHKTEFYRLHGQGLVGFRNHVYLMEKAFATGVSGMPHLYLVTAPIYLTCVAFHVMRRMQGMKEHDGYAIEMMKTNYENYAANILRHVTAMVDEKHET
jgi:hypothetical protein